MLRHCLDQKDYETVRAAVLRYEQAEGIGHADVAVMCKLSHHSVKDFIRGKSNSCRIVAHLVAYLPLELRFTPPVIDVES